MLLAIIVSLFFSLAVFGTELKYTKNRPFEKKSKIVVTTFFAPGTPYETNLQPIVSPNKAAYAAHNGYDYIDAFEHEDICEIYQHHQKIHPFTASHYFKLRLIVYLMEKYGYEWILWSDGDAIFLNFNQSLEQHFDTDYDVIFPSSGATGKWKAIINTGHFLIRNTNWSFKFFHQAYALSFFDCWDYQEGKPALNGWLKLCSGRGRPLWNDQRVLQYFISYTPFEQYGKHFKHVPMADFNSEFPNYWQRDLVVHFPGRSINVKEKLCTLFVQKADHADGTVNWEEFPELKGRSDTERKIVESEYNILNCAEGWK